MCPPPTRDDIVGVVMEIIAQKGWDSVTISAVARACGGAVIPEVTTKDDLFRFIVTWVDDRMMAAVPDDHPLLGGDSGCIKDRLFELFMARFDAMQEYRAGFIRLVDDTAGAVFRRGDACLARTVALPILKAMGGVLTTVGVQTDGIKGKVKIASMTLVYIMSLRKWVKDESGDLGMTMAELDHRLDQWLRVNDWVG